MTREAPFERAPSIPNRTCLRARAQVQGYRIVKFDVDTEALVRSAEGRCVECAPGEPGELLMPIVEGKCETSFSGSGAEMTPEAIGWNPNPTC